MIYFVQADIIGRIKIGYSGKRNLKHRLASLQTASPVHLTLLAVIPGKRDKEQQLHQRFAEARLHGEWFSPVKRLVRYIAGLQGKKLCQHHGRVSRVPRKDAAAAWLTARFKESKRWLSQHLFVRAKQDSISRQAILEAREVLQLPRPRKIMRADGVAAWEWWVPDNWPVTAMREAGDLGDLLRHKELELSRPGELPGELPSLPTEPAPTRVGEL